jgi:hypothetical protein
MRDSLGSTMPRFLRMDTFGPAGQVPPELRVCRWVRSMGLACQLNVARGSCSPTKAPGQVAPKDERGQVLPNQRLKLSARGGRSIGKGSILIAAAAGRSLSAIR